jgi:Cu-processing system permease protein
MSTTVKVLRYELRDVIRSRALILHGLFFLAVTWLLFRYGGGSSRALLSLSSVTLLAVPLVSTVLGIMFVYNAREFNELLLSHPTGRRQLFGGLYLGLTLPLVASYLAGVLLPVAIHGLDDPQLVGTVVMLCVAGTMLTAIFTALAFTIALRFEDRVRGMGVALLVWIFLAVAWDALVMAGANAFWAWPLERPLLVAMVLNPIDLARVLLMLNLDVSAMMGYTGAVFQRFFGGTAGLAVAFAALTLWLALPLTAGFRRFCTKDF